MKWLAPLVVLTLWCADVCFAQQASVATLKKGQTLEDLASKLYDDPQAAHEIRSLNGFAPDSQPALDQPFQLPGKDRKPAVSALSMARQAVVEAEQTGAPEYAPERFRQAQEHLSKARGACRSAEYERCQNLADETWATARLARKESAQKQKQQNRFAVSVDEKGTTVEVLEGDGVEVTAQKKSKVVRRNQAVKINKGKAPQQVTVLPKPPKPILPFPGSTLVTSSILFRWQSVPRAARYVLLISKKSTGHEPLRQITTEKTAYLFHSSLADGEYYWFLRAVDSSGVVGRPSQGRKFRLVTNKDSEVKVETQDRGGKKGP